MRTRLFRKIPNLLTIFRLILVPFVVSALWHRRFRMALALVFIAGVTDVVDGFLARHFAWTTRVGAYLDPIADKSLLVSVYIMLGINAAIPRWLVGLVLGRDVLILGMVASGFLFTSIRNFPPSVWGKVSTFLQIVTALVVMGTYAFPSEIPNGILQQGLVVMTGAAAIVSGVNYAWRGYREWRSSFSF